jgi:hypothetical protein
MPGTASARLGNLAADHRRRPRPSPAPAATPAMARALARCWSPLATFLLSMPLFIGLRPRHQAGMQFEERAAWIPVFDIYYHLGVDGISMPLILLTTFFTVLVVLAGWESIEFRCAQYMASFLIMGGHDGGMFAALDAMLFYVFFEGMLIPMFLIIGIWGGPPGLRRLQVLPLHAARLAADAGRADLPLLPDRQLRDPRLPRLRDRHDRADAGCSSPSSRLRRQGADVAGAHLAARRPRRGADRRLGDPGRHHAEDGRLRLPALLAADRARRLARSSPASSSRCP